MIDKFSEMLHILLQGRIPEALDTNNISDEGERHFANLMNQMITCMQEIHDFVLPLSKGELAEIQLSPKNFLGSPFKELHSRLLHLTWQANQVANGDYSQRVDFMGEFSDAFNNMISALNRNEKALKKKILELETALSHIGILEGILPICCHCKKIRLEGTDPEDMANWVQVEKYLYDKTEARFSHSICPECMRKHYPDD
jgi:phosphoserine phosphatase RsbU/P